MLRTVFSLLRATGPARRIWREMVRTISHNVCIYLDAMSMENSLLQSYRMLFIALETVLFAAVFALLQLQLQLPEGIGVLVIGVVGLVVGVMWIIVCHAKGRDVDKWRTRLLEETSQGDLQGYFSYMESGLDLAGGKLARYWFNWIMPILIMGLWVWIIFIR